MQAFVGSMVVAAAAAEKDLKDEVSAFSPSGLEAPETPPKQLNGVQCEDEEASTTNHGNLTCVWPLLQCSQKGF